MLHKTVNLRITIAYADEDELPSYLETIRHLQRVLHTATGWCEESELHIDDSDDIPHEELLKYPHDKLLEYLHENLDDPSIIDLQRSCTFKELLETAEEYLDVLYSSMPDFYISTKTWVQVINDFILTSSVLMNQKKKKGKQ